MQQIYSFFRKRYAILVSCPKCIKIIALGNSFKSFIKRQEKINLRLIFLSAKVFQQSGFPLHTALLIKVIKKFLEYFLVFLNFRPDLFQSGLFNLAHPFSGDSKTPADFLQSF